MDAQSRIHEVAVSNGWRTRSGQVPTGSCIVDYLQGTRRVTVYYGVRGQVIEASRQTGSTGGSRIVGKGKESRVVESLSSPRWTR